MMDKLYKVVKPVWNVWPELKPQGISYRGPGGYSSSWSLNLMLISEEQATAPCIAAMVKGLMKEHKVVLNEPDDSGPYVILLEPELGEPFEAPTLVEALALACIAFKAAAVKEMNSE